MKSIYASLFATAGLMTVFSVMATEMPALAKKNNCTACHSIDKKTIGPAWSDISKRYKGAKTYSYRGKDYPLEEGLMMKVSKGGPGNWGTMPMPANAPAVKDADLRELVKFVLALEK